MSRYQSAFNKFHDKIKLSSENLDLRKSRDAIKTRINSALKDYLNDKDIPMPSFFDQGSYALHTGLKPKEEEYGYDIDEGVKFEISKTTYSDPVSIKKILANSLKGHTELGVKIKEPCVRVIYSEDGKEKYHVDLAVYATDLDTGTELYLARGKENSDSESKKWEISEPELLIKKVNEKFKNELENAQFKRIIRFLKRWKDIHFPFGGNAAPRSIALTIFVYYYFTPKIDAEGNADDLSVLINLSSIFLQQFQPTYNDGEYTNRCAVYLPVSPKNDLFKKMSNKQMEEFKNELEKLHKNLTNAQNSQDEQEGLNTLSETFGDDFPSDISINSFTNRTKPVIGFFPEIAEISGYNDARPLVKIKGYTIVGKKRLPIFSDRRILNPGKTLMFRAFYPLASNLNVKWRVFNTGEHVKYLVNSNQISTERGFRGDLFDAKSIDNKTLSSSPLINYESTEYTGKHWIECLIFHNDRCIAKSNPFFINIYNSKFPNYE